MTLDGGRQKKLEEALKEEWRSSPELSKNTQLTLTKELVKQNMGRSAPAILSEDFVYDACYESPKTKREYLDWFSSINIEGDFPFARTRIVSDSMYVEWDSKVRDQSYKVWCTIQFRGTPSGDGLRMGRRQIPATGVNVVSAPEVCSFTYNEEGKCTRISAGYMADHAYGNTKNRGGYHRIFNAIGHPLPKPHSLHKYLTDAFLFLLGVNNDDLVWVLNVALFAFAVNGGDVRSLFNRGGGATMTKVASATSLVGKKFSFSNTVKGSSKHHPLSPHVK